MRVQPWDAHGEYGRAAVSSAAGCLQAWLGRSKRVARYGVLSVAKEVGEAVLVAQGR